MYVGMYTRVYKDKKRSHGGVADGARAGGTGHGMAGWGASGNCPVIVRVPTGRCCVLRGFDLCIRAAFKMRVSASLRPSKAEHAVVVFRDTVGRTEGRGARLLLLFLLCFVSCSSTAVAPLLSKQNKERAVWRSRRRASRALFCIYGTDIPGKLFPSLINVSHPIPPDG